VDNYYEKVKQLRAKQHQQEDKQQKANHNI